MLLRCRTRARAFHGAPALAAKVGFIGLGHMGKPMALNLLKAGNELVVFDVASAPMLELEGKGAKRAANPSEVSMQDIIITMLPSSPHVREVYDSAGGIFAACKPGTLLVDCSTIDPTVTRSLAATALKKKFRMIDAPVSGGVGGAEAGTLTFMIGGSAPDYDAARAVLASMGKNIVHCGGAGAGQVAKLCNNLILGITMNAVSEAMNLGVKLGADPKTLAAIINTSSGRCWSSDTYNPCPGVMPNVPASRGYSGGFGSALMAKDLGLALDAAKSVGAPLPTGSTAHAVYQIMLTQNFGDRDFSAVYAFLHGATGESSAK